jgi:hypothetical protein
MMGIEAITCGLDAEIAGMRLAVEEHERQLSIYSTLRSTLGDRVRELEALIRRKESAIRAHNKEVDLLARYCDKAAALAAAVMPVVQQLSSPVSAELVNSDELACAVRAAAIEVDCSMDSRCGVYFLLLDEEIVYIGQSIDIYARISAHKKDCQKNFNKTAWVPIPSVNLNDVESALIAAFRPSQNRMGYAGAGATNYRTLEWAGGQA